MITIIKQTIKWIPTDTQPNPPLSIESHQIIMDSLNYTLPIRLFTSEYGIYNVYTCIITKLDTDLNRITLDLSADDYITIPLHYILSAERQ